jgi:hypothetical protein
MVCWELIGNFAKGNFARLELVIGKAIGKGKENLKKVINKSSYIYYVTLFHLNFIQNMYKYLG